MAKEKLEIEITAKDNASKEISGIDQALRSIGKLGPSGLLLGGGLAALTLGATAATGTIAGLGAGLSYSISEAIEAEDVLAQMEAVLAATDGAAGMTSKALQDLATDLSQVTKFTEEDNLAVETMLLQFKNIGSKVFPQATEMALDLATRLGMDATSAAKLLGKALETPGEGLLRLKQAGVAFTEEQTDMVKSMVEAGNAAGAQQYIMDALAKSVGGAAQAAGQTFSGQMEIMKNNLSEVAESIGVAVMPALTETLSALKPFIVDLSAQLTAFVQSDQFKQWIEALVNWLKNDLPLAITSAVNFWNTQLKPAFENAKPVFEKIWEVLKKVGEVLGVILPPAIALFVGAWNIAFDLFKLAVIPIENIWKAFKTLWEWIGKVKDGLSNLALPDWLTPGSPTPLELGLRGINSALKQVSTSGLSFGGPQVSMAGGGAAGGGGMAMGGITVVYSPGMSLGSQAEFETQFIPLLTRALGKVNRGKV